MSKKLEKPEGYVFGRPTKYRKEYCQKLIDHMAEGLSFDCFGGDIPVVDSTLYYWLDKHPDFSEAYKIGKKRQREFWEKLGRAGAAGKIDNFNSAAWIFNMKNRFAWKNDITINSNQTRTVNVNIEAKETENKLIEDLKTRLLDKSPIKDITPVYLKVEDDKEE